VVAKEAGEQEITRSRLAEGEIRRQRAERLMWRQVGERSECKTWRGGENASGK
jgi:hypothetical protein